MWKRFLEYKDTENWGVNCIDTHVDEFLITFTVYNV